MNLGCGAASFQAVPTTSTILCWGAARPDRAPENRWVDFDGWLIEYNDEQMHQGFVASARRRCKRSRITCQRQSKSCCCNVIEQLLPIDQCSPTNNVCQIRFIFLHMEMHPMPFEYRTHIALVPGRCPRATTSIVRFAPRNAISHLHHEIDSNYCLNVEVN